MRNRIFFFYKQGNTAFLLVVHIQTATLSQIMEKNQYGGAFKYIKLVILLRNFYFYSRVMKRISRLIREDSLMSVQRSPNRNLAGLYIMH